MDNTFFENVKSMRTHQKAYFAEKENMESKREHFKQSRHFEKVVDEAIIQEQSNQTKIFSK